MIRDPDRLVRFCARCLRMVPQHHMHGGRADFFIPDPVRASDQYHCVWCRQAVTDNETNCQCAGAKKARKMRGER